MELSPRLTKDQRALWQRLAAWSPDRPQDALPFSAKLAQEQGWSRNEAARAIEEYRRFVFLCLISAEGASPSRKVDAVWHLHLSYTRDYWEEFCPGVLGRPLHHNPSRGGDEDARYSGLYRQTLTAYRDVFGQDAPVDLWPDPDYATVVRAMDRAGGAEVDPFGVARIAAGAGLVLTLLAAIGAGWNVFDYTGPRFLTFYVGLILAFLGGGHLLLSWALSKAPHGIAPDADLDPYQFAYLDGGPDRAFQVVVADLLQHRAITIDDKTGMVRAEPGVEVPRGLARGIFGAIRGDTRLADLRRGATMDLEAIRDQLADLGLLTIPDRPPHPGRWGWSALAVLLAVGAIKMAVGLSREAPVGFLFGLMCGAAVCGFVVISNATKAWTLTRLGREMLAKTTRRLRSKTSAAISQTGTVGPGLLWAVAASGAMALMATEWSGLQRVIDIRSANAGSSASCGSSGGDSGGGCGGCGGGGGD